MPGLRKCILKRFKYIFSNILITEWKCYLQLLPIIYWIYKVKTSIDLGGALTSKAEGHFWITSLKLQAYYRDYWKRTKNGCKVVLTCQNPRPLRWISKPELDPFLILTHTVFAPIMSAAIILFWDSKVRPLFEGGH